MNYSKRVWLNPEDTSSTGSVVVFDGESQHSDINDNTKAINMSFVQISDCHQSIRLHKCDLDTEEDFLNKVLLLRDTLSDFVAYLQSKQS